ncbi:NAD(P)/FAD-dependent oxidoreductase [Caenimonas koreensis]|nr:NAD(P)/FAD-dependent oxidoreductase [Caenimonas koreensis]
MPTLALFLKQAMHTQAPIIKTIAIAGGGFAGTTLARAIQNRLRAGWQVVLVSEESYTTFNPMLAEVVGAAIFPEHVIVPIREIVPATRFIMGRVQHVDTAMQVLVCSTLAGPLEIAFDHLVLAFGQRANLSIIPGLAEYALPLKLVGDAMHIRNQLLQRLAHMELVSDEHRRRSLGHFVVIGGGFSGVEVAGAIADFIRSARRSYRRVNADELRISLLHDTDCLLPELPARLGKVAASSLRLRGVDVRLGTRAARVDAHGVELDDGTWLAANTVVCTIGTSANPLVEQLAVKTLRGRIVTAPNGRVAGVPGLWAIGDCAATVNAADGRPCPPTAQFAIAQAEHLARNLIAHIDGRVTLAFRHRSRGMMATTGHHKGVAQVFGIALTGLPAWMLWRAYYLMRMPTPGRKLRIWVEWTWSLFFPADITHLRFTRTAGVDAPLDQRVPAHPAPIPKT